LASESAFPPLQFNTLTDRARRTPPLSVAVVDAADRSVLESVALLLNEKIMNPVLVGNEKIIRALVKEMGIDPDLPIVPANSEEDAARESVRLVSEGAVQALMKGHLHSDLFLHPILEQLRTGARISHVYVAQLPTYHKLLFITDAAINIAR
jgi:phosphate butyryltransferase